MRFLLEAVRKNSRRLRIEQLILLAVRAAILILVVVALAEIAAGGFGGHLPTAATGAQDRCDRRLGEHGIRLPRRNAL